jgi:HK97 family phage portal protein
VDRERLTGHPMHTLLSRPNPYTTRYRLVECLASDLAIYDNAFLAKVTTDRPGVLRLDPRHLRPLDYNQFAVETYRYQGIGQAYHDFARDEIVHFRGCNAEDDRWGCSPMETLRRIFAEEFQAAQYREQLWRNGAWMTGYLTRPAEAPQWSDGARTRFRKSWQSQYTGTGPSAGRTPILEDGMGFVTASVTPESAQYIEARKLTREEVAAAYHIPLPMVGIVDHATYGNITEQHKNLYQDTLGPWLTMITEELELQLLPDFPDIASVYLEFNLAEKLRGFFEEQAAQLQQSVDAPCMTRNEARAIALHSISR